MKRFLAVLLGAAFAAGASSEAADIVQLPSGTAPHEMACLAAKAPSAPQQPPPKPVVPPKRALGPLAVFKQVPAPGLDPETVSGFAPGPNFAPGPKRIAIWGDSHVAAGPLVPQLFAALEARGLKAGTYFLPPTMGRSNIRHPMLRAHCIGDSWTTDLAWKMDAVSATGPGLADRVVSAGEDATLSLDLRDRKTQAPQIASLQIVYEQVPSGTRLAVSVNDGPERAVDLSAGQGGTAFLTVTSDQPIATMSFKVAEGTWVLQGFILDYAVPPDLTLDVFGLPGSTARGWRIAEPGALASALGGQSYDAVILAYGTNEGNAPDFDPGAYREGLRGTLEAMRAAFPQAACVLMGPPDRGVQEGQGGDFLKYARVHQAITAAQRDLAPAFGCAFWDWQAFMGGPGGAYGWYYASPSLMGRDLTHLSMDGYRRTGRALALGLGW
jgi:lysophospholipase L1-like esterase